jgi:hypothetical protein
MSSHFSIKNALPNQYLVMRCCSRDNFHIEKQTNELFKLLFDIKTTSLTQTATNTTNTSFNETSLLQRSFEKLQKLLIDNRFNLNLISIVIYYSLTTFLNRQTLGQEYFNLIFYDSKLKSSVSLQKRFLFILFKILMFNNDFLFLIIEKISNNFKSLLVKLIFFCVVIVKKIYKILFLIDKRFFNSIENHLLNIKYLFLGNNQTTSSSSSALYTLQIVLALLKSFILLINVHKYIKSYLEQLHKDKEEHEEKQELVVLKSKNFTNLKCLICLNMINEPTALSCGHIYDWSCIQNYFQMQPSQSNASLSFNCPNCRFLVEPKKCVRLVNF